MKGKTALVEAPTPTLDPAEISCLSKNSRKFSTYRFVSLPLQEEAFHDASLLVFLHFLPSNIDFDLLVERGFEIRVSNSSMEQGFTSGDGDSINCVLSFDALLGQSGSPSGLEIRGGHLFVDGA
jgi:hypothetical protein